MHQNIAGLLSKSDAITVCLYEIEETGTCVDIICITEHFIKAGYEPLLTIPNYQLAACYARKESKRGGACILTRNGLQFKELQQIAKLSETGVFECCAIELIKFKIAIACVYRTPRTSNFVICMEKFNVLLQELIKKSYQNIIIAGDFNIDTLKKTTQSIEFESLLLRYNLKLAIKQPTRITSHTCIDNFAHNFGKNSKTQVLELALSDHTAQFIKIPVQKCCTIKYWRKNRRNFSTEYLVKFKKCISSLSFCDVYRTGDPNIAYNNFIEIFSMFYFLCFPKETITIHTTKKAKWVSRGIRTCSKRKRYLLWQYRHNCNPLNKENLINYSKKLKKIIQLTQLSQNNYKIKTSQNKCKTTWDIIKASKYNVPRNPITKIQLNNETISDPQQIANTFNKYFIEKVTPIIESGNNVTSHILNRKNSFFMPPCVPHDIIKIINSLKNTSSVGYDQISTKVLKFVAVEISPHLSHILNLSISAGTFPESLKTSIVKPIFKKENKECMEFYRPISLINIVSKIFEKHIYKELTNYLEKNNILANEQKGFRENCTINLAIYDFLHKVMINVDKTNPVCTVFCDMTQAFDYVRHDILLQKLESYGIRGNILKLIQSYLSNRKQITEINSINKRTKCEETYQSDMRLVKYGVPQGSVLGPLLFNLYINDLPKHLAHPVSLFADDSTITIPCNNKDEYKSEINNSIESVIKWLDNNNLKINLNKTNIIHFGQRTSDKSDIKIQFNNKIVDEVSSTKYLGLIIDKKLNWKDHIELLVKKVNTASYALFKLSTVLKVDGLLTAYHGLVSSCLRYGVIFWGNSTDKELVFKAQKKSIRAMFKLLPTDSCKPYFQKYKILTLPSLYIFEIVMFVKLNSQLFPRLSDVKPRNRRDNFVLCLHGAKTALMQRSVFCMAPKIYNKLPKLWREQNLLTLKKTLKEFLVEKAYYTVLEFLNDKI